jgi:APA family basic amino acid/polyamine antiporter
MPLKRTLGTSDLTFLVIGNVIGSGIFLVPSEVLRASGGSVTAASLVWLLGGVLSLLGALSYGELSAMEGGTGGLYGFIRDGFGRLPAFLYGWTLFFVIGSGTIATLAVAAANYLGQFTELSPVARKVVADLFLLGIMVMTVRGTRGSASVQNVATAVKVGAILLMSALLFALGDGGAGVVATAPEATTPPLTLAAAGLALIPVLWAYEGWQYVTFSDGEALDPQRALPRAIALGTASLVAIYLVANFAYLAALGPERVMASDRVAGEAVAAVLGDQAARLLALAIIISMLSAALATVLTAPRVFYNMANDGVFFRALGQVNPKFGTPALAIIACCLWAMVFPWVGTFSQLLNYVVFVGWIFYGLGAAAVIALRIKRPGAHRPFRVPGYPLTPALFVLAAAAIVVNTVVSQPRQAAIGLGMVLLGAPAYFVWRRSGTA